MRLRRIFRISNAPAVSLLPSLLSHRLAAASKSSLRLRHRCCRLCRFDASVLLLPPLRLRRRCRLAAAVASVCLPQPPIQDHAAAVSVSAVLLLMSMLSILCDMRDPITVHLQPYIIYYPVTDRYHTLLQFIINLPINRPYYSSFHTPSSEYQIRVQIVKRISN